MIDLITREVKSFDERVENEREARIKNGERRLEFGVSFLDEALSGIYPNDFILIGAKTGHGKTQLSTLIALENAAKGKRVLYIALEAEHCEIERRVKYRQIADRFFSTEYRPNIHLNFLDWYYGKLDEHLKHIEQEIQESGERYPTLKTYYRTRAFGATEFEQIYLAMKDTVDLVIVDHLHYFDLDDDNENRAVKQVMTKIRDCALIAGNPVVLVAHIRKTDRRLKQLVPDIEDFHGSSDIGKIPTKVILIGRKFDNSNTAIGQTWFNIQKCRADGERMNVVALMGFNFKIQSYQREYFVGRLSFDGTEFTPFDFSNMPFWAKNGRAVQGGP